MKKKLLFILPALLALSACGGANPKENNQEYLETTNACEQVFGEAEVAGELKVRRNSEAGDLLKPVVGVQYKNLGGDKYAVRYIAAIASLNVKAYWTRGLTDITNDPVKPLTGGKESTTAYTKLQDGDQKITPADFAEDARYNYFVTYSMYNIPASKLTAYMIGYLTLQDDAQPKVLSDVTSDAVVSQVDSAGVCFTVPTNQEYFMGGTLKGVANSVVNADGDTLDTTNNNASFTYDFAANDYFCVFKHNPAVEGNYKFEVCGYSKLQDKDGIVTYNGQNKVSAAAGYALYISKDANKIYKSQTHQQTTGLYFIGPAINGAWTVDEDYQLLTDPRNVAIFMNAYISEGDFKIATNDWTTSYGWYGYALNGASWTADYSDGKYPKGDGVSGNFKAGASDNNITCLVAGYYNFYINSNNQLYIYAA